MFGELVLHPDSAALGWRELLAKVIDAYAAEALRSGRRSVIGPQSRRDEAVRGSKAMLTAYLEGLIG